MRRFWMTLSFCGALTACGGGGAETELGPLEVFTDHAIGKIAVRKNQQFREPKFSSEEKHGGERSLELRVGSYGGPRVRIPIGDRVIKDAAALSMWVKSSLAVGSVTVRLSKRDEINHSLIYSVFKHSGIEWTQVVLPLPRKYTANMKDLVVDLDFFSDPETTVWLDDVVFITTEPTEVKLVGAESELTVMLGDTLDLADVRELMMTCKLAGKAWKTYFPAKGVVDLGTDNAEVATVKDGVLTGVAVGTARLTGDVWGQPLPTPHKVKVTGRR